MTTSTEKQDNAIVSGNAGDEIDHRLLKRAWRHLCNKHHVDKLPEAVQDVAWKYACTLVIAGLDPQAENDNVAIARMETQLAAIEYRVLRVTKPRLAANVRDKVIFSYYSIRASTGDKEFPFQQHSCYQSTMSHAAIAATRRQQTRT